MQSQTNNDQMKKEIKRGYKVTDENMQCRGFQFELNKVFKEAGDPIPCKKGFHYCLIAADCFDYYGFSSSNRVFEIIDHGKTIVQDNKSCTNEIQLVRELTWHEVLNVVNSGKDNTGLKNTGNRNTGYRNTGYRNTGAFCTNNNPKVLLFDNETDILVRDWENHPAFELMANYLNVNIWIWSNEMTDEEKEKFPSHKTSEGYLKSIPPHEAWYNMWHNLTDKNKKVFTSLPNFDKVKFKEITGIDV